MRKPKDQALIRRSIRQAHQFGPVWEKNWLPMNEPREHIFRMNRSRKRDRRGAFAKESAMKKQHGVVTWFMLLVTVAVGSGGLVVSHDSRFSPKEYTTLESCLEAVDKMNGAMAATRAGETPGTVKLEWKFRCLQVGAP